MMKVRVYNGEYYERSKRWYLGFGVVILLIIVTSIRYDNLIGAIIMLMIVGGYLYVQTRVQQNVYLTLEQNFLAIGKRKIAYSALSGFVLEADRNTGELRNLVLIGNHIKDVLTFEDQKEVIEEFVNHLQEVVPQLDTYELSTLDKIMRKLKI